MTWVLALALIAQSAADRRPNQPVYLSGNGVTSPRLVSEVKPHYPSDAMRAGITGTVVLEGVVQVDGTVSDVHVVRPLDSRLDAEAVNAFKGWRFSPGLKDGQAVAVRVTTEMTFTMADIDKGAPIVVFSRTEPDGTKVSFEIPRERFRQLAAWDSALTPSPSLSVGDAIRIASARLNSGRQGADATPYRLMGAAIARVGGPGSDRWYYQVDFAPIAGTGALGTGLVTTVVLFDGTVVEPRAEKQP